MPGGADAPHLSCRNLARQALERINCSHRLYAYAGSMHVEKLKYLIWAQDMARAVGFYQTVFDAEVARQSEVMAELLIAGSTLGIHSGGEGKRTWTGLSFQVGDLFAACNLLSASGGTILRPPKDTPEEPAHLAMCADPEGNEIMLTIPRPR
jgi:lactoylglutathione lyase